MEVGVDVLPDAASNPNIPIPCVGAHRAGLRPDTKLELDMKISKLVALSLIATAGLPAAVMAQEAPAAAASAAPDAAAPATGSALAAGQTVYGPQGEAVATVVSVDGANVVIDTGTAKATLPATALTPGAKGPSIAYNKDQLNAAISAATQPSGGAAGAEPAQKPQG